jgi:predicted phage tail protein
MLREIRLYGDLGRRFGRVHHYAVSSVGEALRALMANFDDFERTFVGDGAHYRVWTGGARLHEAEDVNLPTGGREIIRIAPVIAGAKKGGLGSILLGVALIAAAVFMPAAIAGIGFFGTTVGGLMGSIGLSLVLGGVAQMLAPQPKNEAGSQESKNSPSYVFNGAVNTTAQGQPVPVGYGRLIVGSAVISAGLSTTDIPT